MLDGVAAHARGTAPDECCGFLLGTDAEIVDTVRSANLADDPTRRFLIDPKTHFETRRRAAERGLAIVGFYHSHPASEPVPSASDLAGATYADQWYLIVRPLPSSCQARLFRLDRAGFVEIGLKVDSDP